MHRALGKADIAIDRRDHLGDRNRLCPASQTITAGGTPGRRYQTGMGQALQQLSNSCLGQSRCCSDRTGGYLAVRQRGEVGSDNDAVIGELAEDNHRFLDARSGRVQIRTDLVRYKSYQIGPGQA